MGSGRVPSESLKMIEKIVESSSGGRSLIWVMAVNRPKGVQLLKRLRKSGSNVIRSQRDSLWGVKVGGIDQVAL